MRIAYLTADEVNSDLAQRWALERGFEVVPVSPGDPFPNGDFDAAIYDLDFLAPTILQQVLANLLTDPSHAPAAVHGYNLRRRQANGLLARGVFVRRKLDRGILAMLQRKVRRLQAKEQLAWNATPSASRPETLGANALGTTYACIGG
jgi:hypothetical protein